MRAGSHGGRRLTELFTTPFGMRTTAAEVVRGVDLSGKRAVVTGAASGIGVETARALREAGAEVTAVTRQMFDLMDLDAVRAFATSWEGPLHILVCNAGVMACPEARAPNGWESQLATNHLGHFALATGLRPALAAARGARIVSVSSSGHLMSPVVFDDLHFNFRPYDPWLAYGQSKTANILFAVGAAQRWADDGIVANALMPGAIATNLQRHVGGTRTPPEQRKTPEQGAATSVLLAASPLVEGVTGRYFEDCNEVPVVTTRDRGIGVVAFYALDADNAERLWEVSERALA